MVAVSTRWASKCHRTSTRLCYLRRIRLFEVLHNEVSINVVLESPKAFGDYLTNEVGIKSSCSGHSLTPYSRCHGAYATLTR
jgi:hypothetical protein